MNAIKLQGTKSICKNQSHFYTIAMNYQKEIKRTIPFTIASKRIKIFRKKLNQGGEILVC